MQPMAVFDALAYAQSNFGTRAMGKVLKEVGKTWINPKLFSDLAHGRLTSGDYYKQLQAANPKIQLRADSGSGDVSTQELVDRVDKISGGSKLLKLSMIPLQWGDVITASGVTTAFEKILLEEGLSVEEAKKEAGILMELTASSSDVSYRPHWLAQGEMAKTLLTFQSFALNRWGLVAHDLVMGTIKGDAKKKLNATMGIMMIAGAAMLEDQFRRLIYNTMHKKDLPDDERNLLVRLFLQLAQTMPVVGAIFDRGHISLPPLARVFDDMFAPVKDPTEFKNWFKFGKNAATLGGVPGTSQGMDIIQQLFLEDSDGGGATKVGKPKVIRPKVVRPKAN
jgi:hypothetical protein